MRNWLFSLQFRLMASFALVLSLALGGVSVYIGLAADREADRLQGWTDRARANRIERMLSQFYSTNNGWQGLQPMLERTGFLAGREIVVLDEDGAVVGDTGGPAETAGAAVKGKSAPIVVANHRVGSVLIGPGHGPRRSFAFGRPGVVHPEPVR